MSRSDIIVVGGGHAGIEAAVAAARMGFQVTMVTMDPAALGRMSCNPTLGGTAKGHLVREIDALGGVMGRLADATGIQFRILNRSKGPAIHSTRCQSDRHRYGAACVSLVDAVPGLTIHTGCAGEVLTENGQVVAIRTTAAATLPCRAAIIAAGTFLDGLLFTGLEQTPGGRHDEPPALGLTASLAALGIKSARLKTGTPPRIAADSVDFGKTEAQYGETDARPFSMLTDPAHFPQLPQVPCHLTWTNERTHAALRRGFDRSPLFSGLIKGAGPRYCPSIEDKLNKFPDRDRHQIFLEPEGLDDPLLYVNGFPTSLPADIQEAALRTIPGLEEVRMLRPGYAVEYVFFPADQIRHTLESRVVQGLYFAGQVNGTSGYEEAAAQGLLAGINAALALQGRPPFVLTRAEAYIGVLIDDLITRVPSDPYRMFTSRAEFRLLLREDNATHRLIDHGRRFGLVDQATHARITAQREAVAAGKVYMEKRRLSPAEAAAPFTRLGQEAPGEPVPVAKLCRRSGITLEDLFPALCGDGEPAIAALGADAEARRILGIELGYDGYIQREAEAAARLVRTEHLAIPADFDYAAYRALSREARDVLARKRPTTFGQALRLPGMSPADGSVLLVLLRGKS